MLLYNYSQGFKAAQLEQAGLRQVISGAELLEMRDLLDSVRVDEGIIHYIPEIVSKSRNHRSVYLGASPRASIGLLTAGRARAASEGRDFVIPDDIKALAPAVMRHRLILHPDAEIEGVSADDCVDEILMGTTVPHTAA